MNLRVVASPTSRSLVFTTPTRPCRTVELPREREQTSERRRSKIIASERRILTGDYANLATWQSVLAFKVVVYLFMLIHRLRDQYLYFIYTSTRAYTRRLTKHASPSRVLHEVRIQNIIHATHTKQVNNRYTQRF